MHCTTGRCVQKVGKYMQMSYGPESAMVKTAIAGYTPNVPWFSLLMNDRSFPHYYTLNGGGTSSATPQAAAAAALYIQKYRTELDQIAGKDKGRSEIVKAALFVQQNRPAIQKVLW